MGLPNVFRTAQVVVLAILVTATTVSAQPHQIVFDTDFGSVPQDDSYALMLALHSPELEILGITTVAGNWSVEQGTADVLRMLEIANRVDIPVIAGADMPLEHEADEFAKTTYGSWWSDAPPSPPPGGFATKKAETIGAVEFIIDTVEARPGEVTIVAIGPLTNVAMALRLAPGLAGKIRQLVIMGGAIGPLGWCGQHDPGRRVQFLGRSGSRQNRAALRRSDRTLTAERVEEVAHDA